MKYGPCNAYCSHGGICVLTQNHKGKHDTQYCQWNDEESISKEKADELLLLEAKFQNVEPLAEFIIALGEEFIVSLEETTEE
jgi:hypothetical protein